MPERIQLSRAKGWKMPANTVKVDRTTKWGNPMVVGKHGTREDCVRWLALTINGYVTVGLGKDEDGAYVADKLIAYRKHLLRNWRTLAGKNLACWCPAKAPCHADLLLEAVANLAARAAAKLNRTPGVPVCQHRLADARNEAIESGYVCVDCGAMFAAVDHGVAPTRGGEHDTNPR